MSHKMDKQVHKINYYVTQALQVIQGKPIAMQGTREGETF